MKKRHHECLTLFSQYLDFYCLLQKFCKFTSVARLLLIIWQRKVRQTHGSGQLKLKN